jgi:hypothetical protein
MAEIGIMAVVACAGFTVFILTLAVLNELFRSDEP